MKILENGVVRDATPEEIAQRAADDAAPLASTPTPTKEQLLAQLNAIAAQIQALE